MRQTESVPVEKTPIQLKKWHDREVSFSEFNACIGDRILYFSDGVSQAGMGRPEYPLGWGRKNVIQQLKKWISWEDDISSRVLAMKTAIRARQIDGYEPKDDITCGVMYLRHPRSLLVVTGPPYSDTKDAELAQMVDAFEGRKVICGGTTASIIGRELDRDIDMNLDSLDPTSPVFMMEGSTLFTEGTLTLSRWPTSSNGAEARAERANAATTSRPFCSTATTFLLVARASTRRTRTRTCPSSSTSAGTSSRRSRKLLEENH